MKQEADRLLACKLVSKDKKTRSRQTVDVDKYVEKQQNQMIFNSMNDQFCKNIKMDEPNIDVLGKYEPFLGLSEHRMERVLKNGTLEDRVHMLYNLSVDSKLKYLYDDFKKKLLKSVLSEEGAGKHELAKILFRLDAGIKKHMLLPREEDEMFHIDGSYQKMSIILYANMVKMLKENGAGDVVQAADGFMAEYAKTDEALMKIDYSNVNPVDARIAAKNLGLSQSSKVDIDDVTDSILSEKIDEQKLSQWEKEANEGSTTGLLKQFFATELVQSRLNMKLQFGVQLYGMEEEKEAEASRNLIGKLQDNDARLGGSQKESPILKYSWKGKLFDEKNNFTK